MQRKEFVRKGSLEGAGKLRIGIAVAEFNADVTESMLEGALQVLSSCGVKERNISISRVYGSYDIPFACAQLIRRKKPHAVVAIGCIIKGETEHDRYIASAVSHGIMDVMLKNKVPISFGILTTNTLAQARARSRGKTNHGEKAAIAALQAALL